VHLVRRADHLHLEWNHHDHLGGFPTTGEPVPRSAVA
jgi:hypothetical protein